MTIQNVPLKQLRPTEAYLCQASLDFLKDHDIVAQEPLEIVVDENDQYILMDGHNRAYLALLRGQTTVRAEVHDHHNTSRGYGLQGFLNPEVEKCSCLGVHCIHDLASRILSTRAEVIAYQSNQKK